MRQLRRRTIKSAYYKIKCLVQRDYRNGNYEGCLNNLTIAAKYAYQFNWMFRDNDLEDILEGISLSILSKYKPVTPRKKSWVFYDSFGKDNCVLTEQYLKAILLCDVDLFYITENCSISKNSRIWRLLSQNKHVQVKIVDNALPLSSRLNELYDDIISKNPEKIFIQIRPWSAFAVVLFHAFSKVPRYYLNINDHSFWLGVKCTDYSIEFRERGCKLSIEKRGIKEDRIIYLPYYPIIAKDNNLDEIPKYDTGKIVIFSGGSPYKTIDNEYTYFKIIDGILSENRNAILLFAGDGDLRPIRKFIRSKRYQQRVLLIGRRKNITHIFELCDIYLNTYPLSGGLMCQYAATLRKPILSFYHNDNKSESIEQLICHKNSVDITKTSIPSLIKEANKLCSDKNYRIAVGESLNNSIFKEDDFNKIFNKIFVNGEANNFNMDFDIDYNEVFNQYISIESIMNVAAKNLLKYYGYKSIIMFPEITIPFIPHVFPYLFYGIKCRLYNHKPD